MDPATKKVLETMTKDEFSLRRSSHPLQSPKTGSVFNGPMTPAATPDEFLHPSQSVDLAENKLIIEEPKPVRACKDDDDSAASTVSAESIAANISVTPPTTLRRSKRNAATRATSAIKQAISASTSSVAEAFYEDDSIEEESPAKKARITLHVQSRTDSRGHVSPGFQVQSSPAKSTDTTTQSASDALGTGSPRKRTAPSKSKLLAVNEVESVEDLRPQPHGQPLVWAEERQALCETLPYYRAYQSGAYTTEGLALGFLLDKDCGERAYMDEQVVITRSLVTIILNHKNHSDSTHSGGGCKANENGSMQQADDQCSTSSKITSFVNNKQNFVPVGLIVGKISSTHVEESS